MLTVHIAQAGDCASSSTYVRLLLPLAHPAHGGRFVTTRSVKYEPADVIIVERSWTDDMSQARGLVERCRADGACLIYATDDNLLDLRLEGSVAEWLNAGHQEVIRYVAREADGVIVSTELLRRRMEQLNERVTVVPNALDERLLPYELPRRTGGQAAEKCVIGYMGTTTHDDDLAMIAPALQRVMHRHAGRVELQIVGAVNDPASLRRFGDLPVRIVQRGHAVEYPSFMRWMGREVRWDVGLAPLRDDPFTRCKSDIKFLDYAALGIAGIFSRVPPYEASVEHLRTGYLAENTVEAWEEGLKQLVSDGELRDQIGSRARAYLMANRTLRSKAMAWRDAILSCYRDRRRCRPAERRRPDRVRPVLDPVSGAGTRGALVVTPGTVNYFYNRAGERLAEGLRALGWDVQVRTIGSLPSAAEEQEPGRYAWCFLVNVAELSAACGDADVLLRAIDSLQSRCERMIAVALECAGTSWFAESVNLCREAGVPALLDFGFHDQYQQLGAEARRLYRFCFNGLTNGERRTVSIEATPAEHPIPWAFVGSLSPERSALAWRLAREASPDGFLYLPHLSPVTDNGPHLNERQFQRVLLRSRCQVWCSHHDHFYVESERFRNSLLTGSLPLKVLTSPAPPDRVLPFAHLMCSADDAPAALRELDRSFEAAWRRFADEFLGLPSLEEGLAAFLEDERRELAPGAAGERITASPLQLPETKELIGRPEIQLA
jgi:glycosyltransferase involved in cell wall biosynthesis